MTLHIGAPRYACLRQYVHELLEMYAPHLRRQTIQEITASARSAAKAIDAVPLL